ncbi:MAG: hypothetical protein MMC33_003548 [Icmadophila ericetorum]|nr:hypothetical protein [Icmadophila ericetorum]
MPAFTSILRRHLPQYKIFKTRVLPTISSSGFSDRSKKFVFTGVKQPINGHYSNLEAQRPNVVSDQQMELGSFQALCTVIEVGLPGEVTENGIYLEQAIRQTSARHAQADNFGNLV